MPCHHNDETDAHSCVFLKGYRSVSRRCTIPVESSKEVPLSYDAPQPPKTTRHRRGAVRWPAVSADVISVAPIRVQLQATLRVAARADASLTHHARPPVCGRMRITSLALALAGHWDDPAESLQPPTNVTKVACETNARVSPTCCHGEVQVEATDMAATDYHWTRPDRHEKPFG